ncbi:MAG: pyrroline-5-carboxylate reductase [Alphaproteobacteria bacterium]|nr:pyrroline-5-carboxylate reductase [Alphaproteobacteria bacterium]
MKLLIIGCGKMGGSVLDGYLSKHDEANNIRVIEPNEQIREKLKQKKVISFEKIEDLKDFNPDFVFTAVKPFLIGDIIDSLKTFIDKGAALFTIIAGKKIAFFEEHLGKNAKIVRCMPNTPASIGKGITGLVANKNATKEVKEFVNDVFEACGETVWLDDESQIDAVTAVSGSGPAYLFYLTETLVEAAKATGLNEEQAKKLAKATIIGASALMEKSSEEPSKLRQNVTTPNGTTAAALDVLMNEENGVGKLMTKAVLAAQKRSVELGK